MLDEKHMDSLGPEKDPASLSNPPSHVRVQVGTSGEFGFLCRAKSVPPLAINRSWH